MEMTLIFGINEYLEANPAYDSLIFRVHGHHLMVQGCFGNRIFVLVSHTVSQRRRRNYTSTRVKIHQLKF